MEKLTEGKSYSITYRLHDRANAKRHVMNAQVLEVKPPAFGRQEVITNHRPWGEGGTGSIYLDQIVSVEEIARGPVPR